MVDAGEACDTGTALGQPGACPEVTVDLDEDGDDVPDTTYRVFAGIGLACGDKAYRPFMLSPTPLGSAAPRRTYESDDLAYLCLKRTGPADHPSTSMCGRGHLAAGVTGQVVKKDTLSPRTFWLGELTWGDNPATLEGEGNAWNRHWAFLHAGLGSMASRTEPSTGLSPTGDALNDAWDLNPNDADPNDAQTTTFRDDLGMVGLNTATSRNGVWISPYNRASVSGTEGLSAAELNQGEPGYTLRTDVASSGTLQNAMLIDLWVSPE